MANRFLKKWTFRHPRASEDTVISTSSEFPKQIYVSLSSLAEKIIGDDHKRAGKGGFKEYEDQIDNLVYELYDLTKEEITIVEQPIKS